MFRKIIIGSLCSLALAGTFTSLSAGLAACGGKNVLSPTPSLISSPTVIATSTITSTSIATLEPTATPLPPLPQEFLTQAQEHGFHYEVVDGKVMVLTELKNFQHPVDGVERVALVVESAEYVLPLLSGEEVRIPREAGEPAVLNWALVMKSANGEVTHLYAMVDGRAEEKAGWVNLAELTNTMSNRLDGYGVTLDTGQIPETYRGVWEGAARALSTNWGETAFAAWSPRLSRVVYVTGAGEIVGMVNAGVNKVEQLPEGVVWMMGDGNVFVFSTKPQETQFFRRVQLAKKEGAETVWEFEGEDGHRVFAGAARALLYNDWSVQSGQPLPAGQEKYEPLWWIEGEGARYFTPGEAGKRGVMINGKRVEISGPIFVIPGKTAETGDDRRRFEEVYVDQGGVILQIAWAGDGDVSMERMTPASFLNHCLGLNNQVGVKQANVSFGDVIVTPMWAVSIQRGMVVDNVQWTILGGKGFLELKTGQVKV